MAKRFEQYQDTIARLYPETIRKVVNEGGEETKVLSRPITFCVTNACQLRCKYCLPAGTQIKMSDFSSKAIEDIVEGDEILGFEEHNQSGKHTKLQKGVVTQLHHRKASTISLTFENGQELTITPNHKVLVRRNPNKPEYDYREAGKLKVGQTVYMLPYFDVEENFDFVEDSNYIIGYVISMMQGDGCFKYYPDNPKNKYICRLAVKDEEIIDRMKTYLSYLGIRWGSYQFLVSEKDNVYTEALTFNNKASYDILMSLIDDNFNFNTKLNYYKGYLAGLYDAEGHIDKDKSIISLANTDMKIIAEIENALKALGIPYKTSFAHETINGKNLWQVRILGKQSNKYCYKFLQSIHNAVSRKRFDSFYNNSLLKQMKIIDIKENADEIDVYNIGTTCHTYIANNVAVHNCYETHKGNSFMSFETAKKFIDLLLSGEKGMDKYINPDISPAVVIEFIGGEPFLAIDLMDEIMDYWMDRTTELMHPWADKYMISICSNGVAYFEPKVQKFLEKHKDHMSFSVTIDGNKELHNACRVYAGTDIGCYDEAVAAAKDWMDRGYYMGSKVTLAPSNIQYMYDAIMHMVDMGYNEVLANCVYEAEWSNEDALLFYEQGKKLADEFLERNLDFENEFYCSLYEENYFHPKDENDVENWCGGNGVMIACDWDGEIYPCIRYMEMSLGNDQPKLPIGNVDDGIMQTPEQLQNVKCLQCVNRRTQSTDECFNCPIAEGCSWCFPAGTLVSTPNGLIPIEQLEIGDFVYDKDGVARKVYNNLKRETNNLVYVKAAGVQDLLTTKEHPFWAKTVIKRNNNIPTYSEPHWVVAEDLNVADRIGLYVPSLGDKDFDKHKAYILGRYIGDGWKTPSNRKKHPFKYYICCSYDEAGFFERKLKKAGIKYSKSRNKTVVEYRLCITGNEDIISLLDRCGRYAKDKHVPYEVYSWNKKAVKAFLQGYFDADGYFDMKSQNMRYTSISKELVYQIAELVRAVYHKNVSISVRDYLNGKGTINGRTVNMSTAYDGRFNINPSKHFYDFDDENNIMWVNISKSHKEVPQTEIVYNLSVEDNPTFIANGCIVHNCTAWNYQLFGTPDKRCTRICPMHKARCLFNIYFWNKYYLKNNLLKCMDINIPEEWALEIISQEEFDMLKDLYEQAKRNRED